ncbi:MAG: type II toxin-antitoxin system VapC family toxin [Opitutales bacterium]|nr:type II toxin-antitoxin system VapC family toxin [Opitutales bacterium]
MIRYFDSAYIAKLYLSESGSEAVRELAANLKAIACCAHGRVEVAYVFHRKLREGAIDREGLQARMDQLRLDTLRGFLRWLPMDNAIFEAAADRVRDLKADVWLRAADALHLACARENGFETIFSNDRHLLAAASHFGVKASDVIPASP